MEIRYRTLSVITVFEKMYKSTLYPCSSQASNSNLIYHLIQDSTEQNRITKLDFIIFLGKNKYYEFKEEFTLCWKCS